MASSSHLVSSKLGSKVWWFDSEMCPQVHVLLACFPASGTTWGGCGHLREWVIAGRSRVSYPMIPLPGIPHSFPDNGGQELHPQSRTRRTISSLTSFLSGVLVTVTQESIYTQAQSLGLTLLCLVSAVPSDEQA